MPALTLTPSCTIPAKDLRIAFARSSGPGGQNVNKVETKVELRLSLATAALTEARKRRLVAAFPAHVTSSGDFVVTSERYRSQPRNQEDALERLKAMILGIWQPPKARIGTKATRGSRERRLGEKRKRSEVKKRRSERSFD